MWHDAAAAAGPLSVADRRIGRSADSRSTAVARRSAKRSNLPRADRAACHAALSLLLRLLTPPSVRLLRREGSNFLIDLGHAHPLRLTSMQSLFPAADLYLFLAGRRGSLRAKSPSKTPLGRFVTPQIAPPGENDDAAQPASGNFFGSSTSPPPPIKLTLRIVAAHSVLQDPLSATLIPWHRLATLQRLLGLLSGEAIFRCMRSDCPPVCSVLAAQRCSTCVPGSFSRKCHRRCLSQRARGFCPICRHPSCVPLSSMATTTWWCFAGGNPADCGAQVTGQSAFAAALAVARDQTARCADRTGGPARFVSGPALRTDFPFSTLPLWGLASDPERG